MTTRIFIRTSSCASIWQPIKLATLASEKNWIFIITKKALADFSFDRWHAVFFMLFTAKKYRYLIWDNSNHEWALLPAEMLSTQCQQAFGRAIWGDVEVLSNQNPRQTSGRARNVKCDSSSKSWKNSLTLTWSLKSNVERANLFHC